MITDVDSTASLYNSDADDNKGGKHIFDPLHPSPSVEAEFPCVTGFLFDTMHTYTSETFKRRINGIVFVPKEGKLDTSKLTIVNYHLTEFKKSYTNNL